MFDLEINDLTKLEVKSRKHTYHYSTDSSRENPLEATFAALAGCAGVYALKACRKNNLNPMGIQISGKPFMEKESPLMLAKWVTSVMFPDGWLEEDKKTVLEEIRHCAVKELITRGQNVDFIAEEAKKA